MGEAKRRMLAGTYPKPGDALAAAKRFWHGRKPGAAEHFTAPEGTIAITFDVAGVDPSTCLIETASLVPILEELDATARASPYHDLVRQTAREFVRAKSEGDEATLRWIGMLGFWTALNHPNAPDMRRAVAAAMRQEGRAVHLSWRFGPAGLAVALSDQFVDLERMSAAAPPDRVSVYAAPVEKDVGH